MPSSNPILLPWTILLTLLILGAFFLLFFFIININFIKSRLQQNKANLNKIIVLLGIAISGCIFIINTNFISRTSEYNPPHGIVFGWWDDDPENEQFGGTAFIYANDYLPINSGDSALKFISKERFQRYLRPPFLRDKCFTENKIGCTWTDIDIANYHKVLQWLDYLIQIGIATLSGLVASEMMWWWIKKNDLFQMQEVG